jgi:nucleoside phosphorylase/CheY-like chemotaxis protein
MRVLVVHDRSEVSSQIAGLLVQLGIGEDSIRIVEDGVGARSALQSELFDIAIVDLTLPHLKGKTATTYAVAEDLFQELFNASTLHVPGDLIGLTKELDALEKIDSTIGAHLMAIVEEDSGGLWRQRLSDRVHYAMRAAQARQKSINQHFDYDVAIITALDKEFAPYEGIFELREISHFEGAYGFLFQDSNSKIRNGVVYSIGRAGQASAASAAQAIITQFRPALCLMSGFCGGFEAKTQPGEILVSESVLDWDFGKWKGKGAKAVFVPRPAPVSISDRRIYRTLRDLVRSRLKQHDEIVAQAFRKSAGRINDIKMTLAPTASGSAVVADPQIIGRIQNLNENIAGVDMEAYGFYYAASRTPVIRPEFAVIKAVADFCDRTKADKDHDACCYLSAKVVEELIRHRWEF